MSVPDIINGVLETCGGFFIALSVMKLHRAKVVSGISSIHVAFFSGWGFWNLFYYPNIEQWFSFAGGVFLVAVNCIWLGQIAYYNRRNRRRLADAIEQGDDFWEPSLYDLGERTPQAISQHTARMEADQYGGFDRGREFTTTPRFRHADK